MLVVFDASAQFRLALLGESFPSILDKRYGLNLSKPARKTFLSVFTVQLLQTIVNILRQLLGDS